MTDQMKIGEQLPSFTAHDHEGMEIDAGDLIGSPFVLYFYPKDDTPGCTKQACSFRDNMDRLDALDTLLIGVSPDDAASHNRFAEKHGLNFVLLCDEKKALAKQFHVLKEDGSYIRSTFIFDSSGKLRWMEQPVSLDGHVERVLQAADQVVQEEVKSEES